MKYLPVLKHIVLLAKNKNAGVMRYAFIQTYVKGFVDALKITDPKYPGIPELERVTKLENDFSSDCFFKSCYSTEALDRRLNPPPKTHKLVREPGAWAQVDKNRECILYHETIEPI